MKKGVLDKLSAGTRHLVIMVAPVALAWAGTELVPSLKEQYGATTAGAVLVTFLSLVLTTLTKQYGRGAADAQLKLVAPVKSCGGGE
jgi:hypothetical protein